MKQAKIIASSQDKSLDQLKRESLEEKAKEGANYDKARKRQLRLLKKGLGLGTGKMKSNGDERHLIG